MSISFLQILPLDLFKIICDYTQTFYIAYHVIDHDQGYDSDGDEMVSLETIYDFNNIFTSILHLNPQHEINKCRQIQIENKSLLIEDFLKEDKPIIDILKPIFLLSYYHDGYGYIGPGTTLYGLSNDIDYFRHHIINSHDDEENNNNPDSCSIREYRFCKKSMSFYLHSTTPDVD